MLPFKEHIPDFYTSIKALHSVKYHTGAQVLTIKFSYYSKTRERWAPVWPDLRLEVDTVDWTDSKARSPPFTTLKSFTQCWHHRWGNIIVAALSSPSLVHCTFFGPKHQPPRARTHDTILFPRITRSNFRLHPHSVCNTLNNFLLSSSSFFQNDDSHLPSLTFLCRTGNMSLWWFSQQPK